MQKVFTPKKIAVDFEIPIRGVYRLIREGKIKCFRVGRLIRIREADLEAFVSKNLSPVEEPNASDRDGGI